MLSERKTKRSQLIMDSGVLLCAIHDDPLISPGKKATLLDRVKTISEMLREDNLGSRVKMIELMLNSAAKEYFAERGAPKKTA